MKNSIKKKLFCVVFLSMFLISSVPNVLAGGKGKGKAKGKPSSDISSEFVLLYSGADADFGNTIDYQNIEYWMDGVLLTTDSSGIISTTFNDQSLHNFTLIWHGVLIEHIFSSSISESISLATKSIDLSTVYDDIFISVDGIAGEIWYYDVTETYILIGTFTSDLNGDVLIENLAMGIYVINEVGLFDALNNFTLDQPTSLYTTQLIIQPIKTVFDLDYVTSIFG
ncbi:hypothetical protein LCGC14_2793770, partial [marine sediment metagenome]